MKKQKPKLPRVSVPRPALAYRVKKDTLFRKRKHKSRDLE